MITSQWSGGRVQVQVQVSASPSCLPLTSEGKSRIQSIITEGHAPRAVLQRMGAGSDGHFETPGFSESVSVNPGRNRLRQLSPPKQCNFAWALSPISY